MKILVVSDTHGKNDVLKKVIELEKPFDVLVHAGDMEDQVKSILGYTSYGIRIVAGNCDYGLGYPRELQFNLDDRHIMLIHGNFVAGASCNTRLDITPLENYARSKGADILIYGHTHIPKIIQREDDFLIINPGSLSLPRQNDGRPSYCIMEIDGSTADCELKYTRGM